MSMSTGATYPVDLVIDPQFDNRNRLTTAFRIILAIPHMFLSGTMGPISGGGGSQGQDGGTDTIMALLTAGILAIAAFFVAFLSWFAILFTGSHPKSLSDFITWVLRWQARTTGYVMLFRDEYPPFGEGDYPTDLQVRQQYDNRNRLTVLFRFFMGLPHLIILIFLGIAWSVTTIIAWFAILFTGRYPQSLYDFGMGVFGWTARVQAYMFLLVDDYPPFAMGATSGVVDRTPAPGGW